MGLGFAADGCVSGSGSCVMRLSVGRVSESRHCNVRQSTDEVRSFVKMLQISRLMSPNSNEMAVGRTAWKRFLDGKGTTGSMNFLTGFIGPATSPR